MKPPAACHTSACLSDAARGGLHRFQCASTPATSLVRLDLSDRRTVFWDRTAESFAQMEGECPALADLHLRRSTVAFEGVEALAGGRAWCEALARVRLSGGGWRSLRRRRCCGRRRRSLIAMHAAPSSVLWREERGAPAALLLRGFKTLAQLEVRQTRLCHWRARTPVCSRARPPRHARRALI